MESLCSEHHNLVYSILSQIDAGISEIKEWNKDVTCADDYHIATEGTRNLAATSMLLSAIGDGLKRIDKITDGKLLPLRPEIPSSLTIYKYRVESDNWIIPFNYGLINPENVTPHAKNPAIANAFVQMGLVEELGSGVRKIFKYTPIYSDGKQPVIEEDDIYRIVIPYIGKETGKENINISSPVL